MADAGSMTPAARLVRGWLCAALATFLAASSHLVAGGGVPVLAVALAFTFGGLVCVMLAGRRLSLPRVIAGVAVSQVLFHLLFEVLTALPGSALTVVTAGAGHHHGSAVPLASADAMMSMAGGNAGMLVSHVVAGLVGVGLIRHGERLWWALLHALGARVTTIIRLTRIVPVTRGLRPRPVDSTTHGLYRLLHRDTRLRLRGPPVPGLHLT